MVMNFRVKSKNVFSSLFCAHKQDCSNQDDENDDTNGIGMINMYI